MMFTGKTFPDASEEYEIARSMKLAEKQSAYNEQGNIISALIISSEEIMEVPVV